MKLQRSTLLLVAIALLLGGTVLVTQSQRSGSPSPTTASVDVETSPLFEFAEADVVSLTIETSSLTVAFERDDEGFWQMVQPEERPAEDAAIAFLLSRLTTDGLVQTTTFDAANQAEFGLDNPFATVALTLEDGTGHRFILGDADFSGQNYYALIDPDSLPLPEDAGEVEVAIVTENILNGVDRPLEEWQAVIDAAPDATGTASDDDNADRETVSSDADSEDAEALEETDDTETSEDSLDNSDATDADADR
jgi:hypothetical protein